MPRERGEQIRLKCKLRAMIRVSIAVVKQVRGVIARIEAENLM